MFSVFADACGGVFDTANGTITSPSFPETYPGNKHCVWEIIAPHQYRITLNFTHFDLEGNNVYHDECEYDWVEVASKLSDDTPRKRNVFCGSRLPPLLTSEGNSMKIVFSSDNKYVFASMCEGRKRDWKEFGFVWHLWNWSSFHVSVSWCD